ncbi:MAG: hypothetical protein QOJ09_1146, partial [Actinomycetota bacterium]|nr:hypothetical protein [Actinomycetota bacterium]
PQAWLSTVPCVPVARDRVHKLQTFANAL